MRGMKLLGGALALGLLTAGTVARADDPNDPSMKSKAARERDRAAIRELNLRQLDHVRERDARQAEG